MLREWLKGVQHLYHSVEWRSMEQHSSYVDEQGGVTPQGHYRRTPEYVPYVPIRKWKQQGCFVVPMVLSTYLPDPRRRASQALAFHPPHSHYPHYVDDIMAFAFAFSSRLAVYYTMEPSKYMHIMAKEPGKMGFDEISLINLKRRSDRRDRMLTSLAVLGIVDGKALNSSQLQAVGADMLPGYKDSDHVSTRGEIGCFLGHYNIWKRQGLQQVLVLEDDVRFEPRGFCSRLSTIMGNVQKVGLEWDLIYVGRKQLQVKKPERWVKGVSNHGTQATPTQDRPLSSYWTLGYVLSLNGAQKLLRAIPLNKMLPVDEFLPIMFNKHPKDEYMQYYEQRDLRAFSVEPLLLFPTHYTGEPGYFSDTETSTIWTDGAVVTDWDRGGDKHGRGRESEEEGFGPVRLLTLLVVPCLLFLPVETETHSEDDLHTMTTGPLLNSIHPPVCAMDS